MTEGEVDPSADEASDFPSLLSARWFATVGRSLSFQLVLREISGASVNNILLEKAEELRRLSGLARGLRELMRQCRLSIHHRGCWISSAIAS